MSSIELKGLLDDKLAQETAAQDAGKFAVAGVYGAAADKLQEELMAALKSEEEAREVKAGFDTIENEQDLDYIGQLRKSATAEMASITSRHEEKMRPKKEELNHLMAQIKAQPKSNTEARRTLSSQAAIIDAEIKSLEISLEASLEPFVRPFLEFDVIASELMTEREAILHLIKLTGDLKQAQLSSNWQSCAKIDQAISSARPELGSTRRKLSKRGVLGFGPIFQKLDQAISSARAERASTRRKLSKRVLNFRPIVDANVVEAARVFALLRASEKRASADASAAEAGRVAALLREFDEPAMMGRAKPMNSKKSPDKLNIHELKKIITEEGGDFTDIAIGSVLKAGLADRLSSMRAQKASSSSISALIANRG